MYIFFKKLLCIKGFLQACHCVKAHHLLTLTAHACVPSPACCRVSALTLRVDREPAAHLTLEASPGGQCIQASCDAMDRNSISEPGLTGRSTLKPLTWAPGAMGRRNVSVARLQHVAVLEKCAKDMNKFE